MHLYRNACNTGLFSCIDESNAITKEMNDPHVLCTRLHAMGGVHHSLSLFMKILGQLESGWSVTALHYVFHVRNRTSTFYLAKKYFKMTAAEMFDAALQTWISLHKTSHPPNQTLYCLNQHSSSFPWMLYSELSHAHSHHVHRVQWPLDTGQCIQYRAPLLTDTARVEEKVLGQLRFCNRTGLASCVQTLRRESYSLEAEVAM